MTHRAIYLSADLLDLLLASACTRTGNTEGTHYTPGKTEAAQASACSTAAQRTLDTMVRAIRGSAFRITTQGLRPSASARTVKHPAAGETVTTLYHYLRPTERQYSKIPHNNVQYSYNAYGQLYVVQDGSGRSVFYYDAMGNVSKNVRTFAVPFSNKTYTFTMEFEYDSWGRACAITYPDGERVSYAYDCGGDLFAMYGDKGVDHYEYVREIAYNDFGQRSRIEYGNGTIAEYYYDALHRLSQLRSVSASGAMQHVLYNFDGVGNIVKAENTASVTGTLGGTYTNHYIYDHANRLTSSNESSMIYDIGMTYSASGRIARKRAYANGTYSTDIDAYYGYCENIRPHAPKRIFETNNQILTELLWDEAGNLGQVNTAKPGGMFESGRFLFWTEDSRLHTVVDNEWHSYYAYDHAGERTLKLTGRSGLLDVNADIMVTSGILNKATLYPSPYVVVTDQGYTKHYYVGSDRLCARIGGGGLLSISQNVNLSDKAAALYTICLDQTVDRTLEADDLECIQLLVSEDDIPIEDPIYESPKRLFANPFLDMAAFGQAMVILESQNEPETDVYFYHGDHLGSASWITDANGIPVQHLQYLPFGEPFIDQHTSGYRERFTFSGKEKDSETGFYYFGARYYDPSLSGLFLSVDPMADKYPSISPYAYCAWNPVKLVDPDGMEVEYSSLMDRVFVFIERIANKGFRQRYNDLKKSDETYVFKHNNEGNNVLTTDGEKLYINYSADQKQKDGEGDGSTVFSVLRHETEHAVQFEYGELGFGTNEKGEWKPFNFDIHDEIRARDFEASNKIGLNAKALHNLWGGFIDTYEKKIVALKEICRQNNKPMYEMSKLHNGNEKVKNSNTFALPYKERGY